MTEEEKCAEESKIRAILAGDTQGDDAWRWMDEHIAECGHCAQLISELERPMSPIERAAFEMFLEDEKVLRRLCPSLDLLGRASSPAGLDAHLGWCEGCVDERKRLLAGEHVERQAPPKNPEVE